MRTSPSEILGCPKRPKTKNGTEAPSIGSCSDRVVLDVPVAVLRNVIAPPVALDLPERATSTSGVLAPEGSVNRIRQGDGAHVRYCACGLVLLLICKSTVTRGIFCEDGTVFSRLHLMMTAWQEKTAQTDAVLAISGQMSVTRFADCKEFCQI